MTLRQQIVTIVQLPERLDGRKGTVFYRDLTRYMSIDHPLFVFDCRALYELDRAGVYFLLCCLEEAMKRNGDIKLSDLDFAARASLAAVEADRIFEIFQTVADAVASYGRAGHMTCLHDFNGEAQPRENAA